MAAAGDKLDTKGFVSGGRVLDTESGGIFSLAGSLWGARLSPCAPVPGQHAGGAWRAKRSETLSADSAVCRVDFAGQMNDDVPCPSVQWEVGAQPRQPHFFTWINFLFPFTGEPQCELQTGHPKLIGGAAE